MKRDSETVVEREMKVQEVILRALGKRITWWQAAEVLGIHSAQLVEAESNRMVVAAHEAQPIIKIVGRQLPERHVVLAASLHSLAISL